MDIVRAQKFFKGILKEEIQSINEDFSLILEDYDLNEDNLEQLSSICWNCPKLTKLSIRLSHTLTDEYSLAKFLQKLNKRKFETLYFYIKNLQENLFKIFIDFLSKINPKLTSLKITIKCLKRVTERDYTNKILTTLTNTQNGIKNLDLSNNPFDTKENMDLLNKLLTQQDYDTVILGGKYFYNNEARLNVNKINHFLLLKSDINLITSLPIKKLDLPNNNFSQEGIEILASLLSEESTKLSKLDISQCYIGDNGCFILSKGLEKNKSLIRIDLSYNKIVDRGCIAIAQSLLKNKSIKKLIMSNNYITNYGLKMFCEIMRNESNDRFTKLDFASNFLTDEGLIDFSRFLSLHTENRYLKISGKLTYLNIDELFRNASRCNNVKVLDCSSLELPSDSMKSLNMILENNKNIQKFILSNNKKIMPTGMSSLESGIKKNTSIQIINLSQCGIGDEGAESLANGLFNNLSIKEIVLDYNEIGLNGCKPLCEKVLRKRCLKKLNLEHNKIDHTAAFYIGKNLEEAFGIEILGLNSNRIGDEGCEYLATGIQKNNTLNELNLENNGITNKGVRLLAKEIINKKNIIDLNLNSNNIQDIEDELYALFDWIPSLKICHNKLKSDGIIRIFHGTEGNKLYKNLKLGGIVNDKEVYLFKTKNENLKTFDMSYSKANLSLIRNILCLKNLSSISLNNCDISDEEGFKIFRCINDYGSSVKKLFIQNNKINNKGGEELIEVLKNNKTLKEINISDNQFDMKLINKLFEALKDNENLELLMASSLNINDYSCPSIYNLLINNKTLKIIYLNRNKITDKGADLIFSGFMNNNTIVELALNENKLTDKAIINLPKYLKYNNRLKSIELKNNNLTVVTAEYLAKNLKKNSSLVYINLINNLIDYNGMSKIAFSLNKNKNMKDIKLLLNKSINFEEQNKLISENCRIIFT